VRFAELGKAARDAAGWHECLDRLAWQYTALRREAAEDPQPATGVIQKVTRKIPLYPVAALITAALVAFPLAVFVIDRDAGFLPSLTDGWRIALGTVLVSVAVVHLLRWLVPKRSWRGFVFLVEAAAVFPVAWWMVTQHAGWDAFRNWRALLLLFVPLAVTSVILTHWYPDPPDVSAAK
jgi:hypothetical protein